MDSAPSRPAWQEYLLDALELEQPDSPLDSYQASEVSQQPNSDYFRQPRYPYPQRLGVRDYLDQNYQLQIELVKLQNWVQSQQRRLLLVFEGRDTAGKGSTIKALVQHLNPRSTRVVALNKPTEHERGQWYFQRYTQHLPSAGEMVLFDRSWYNRAGVERVMGFCNETEYWQFVQQAPVFEKMLVDNGIAVFKFYLSISKPEQAARIEERRTNPLKHWKLSPIDQEAQKRWDAYSEAKEQTLQQTSTDAAPWTIVKSDDKLRARLNVMRFLLSQLNYDDKDPQAIGAADPLLVASAHSIYSIA